MQTFDSSRYKILLVLGRADRGRSGVDVWQWGRVWCWQVEELEDHYKLQQQLREGVKNMARAYETQAKNANKKASLFNVKAGYKECTQVRCSS